MAARKLVEVQTNWNGADKKMQAALLFNRRLWTIFLSSIAEPDCQFYFHLWTTRSTARLTEAETQLM